MLILPLLALVAAAAAGAPGDRVRDGDFERPDLAFGRADSTPGAWATFIHEPGGATFALAASEGRNGSRAVRYEKAEPANANIHLDQVVEVQPETVYEATAWVKGDGRLQPMLAVMTPAWAVLAVATAPAGTDWSPLRLVFDSYGNDRVRLEWFPGASGRLYTGGAGTSWLDDVTVAPLAEVPEALRQSLALARPRLGDEIDATAALAAAGPVGSPSPLRRIVCRDGVLRYEDGTEVALWGVNFQTALSWEHRGRLAPLGIPLEAAALNRVTDENLAHMAPLGAGVLRLHLLPADFSDAEGRLRDSVFLDALDYLLAACQRAGLYVYLTLVNDMNSRHCPDSFMVGHERETWLFDDAFVACTERYVSDLLTHVNRYSGRAYRDEPAIAVIEIMNEPDYPASAEHLLREPRFAACRDAFERWQREHGAAALPAEATFRTFRYETVRRYIDRMVAAVRAAGATQPVAWNLNWPQFVAGREDVFQATADSRADAVSFCCYPGQADVPTPFWDHPLDLSGRNYLPYLRRCYQEYTGLRWVLGRRFAGKAKLVYEFETFYNQSAYLYPAMAALFRSLGVQIAPMWLYGLSPVAEYVGGSHYLNLYCTPRKALSFQVASRVFRETPRYTPYETATTDEIARPTWAVSFAHDLSLWSGGGDLLHSGPLADWLPLPLPPAQDLHRIAGYGNSPFVAYDGTGAYSVDSSPLEVNIRLLPDARFLRPPWEKPRQRPWDRLCELDPAARHTLTLRLPGWTPPAVRVERLDGDRATEATPADSAPGLTVEVTPGLYRLTRRPLPGAAP